MLIGHQKDSTECSSERPVNILDMKNDESIVERQRIVSSLSKKKVVGMEWEEEKNNVKFIHHQYFQGGIFFKYFIIGNTLIFIQLSWYIILLYLFILSYLYEY